MDKKIPGYILIGTGILLLAYAAYTFINGNGDKPNLTEVMISMICGTVALFTGFHFTMSPGNQSENSRVASSYHDNRVYNNENQH